MKNLSSRVLTIVFLMSIVMSVQAQKSLLWKISGKGLKDPSYLFGTIHMICADDFILDAKTQKAMQNSSKLVLEVNISETAAIQKVQAASFNKNFRNFKQDLTDADAKYIDSCLTADMKMGLKQLGMLKPWAVMMAYSMATSLECGDRKQYETEIIKLIKEQHKPIGELETAEFQMAIFDSIPFTRQVEWLLKAMREKNGYKAMFKQMADAYLAQDINLLNKLTMEDEDMKELADVLFYQRNKNWAPVMATMAKEQSCFFAVGAGHLGGKGGVIDLLRKQGLKVKAVKK